MIYKYLDASRYSCKAKKEASAYCKANGIEPQPRFIAPEED